jgi:hypothetical protein
MKTLKLFLILLTLSLAITTAVGCGDDDDDGSAGSGGSAGSAGSAGQADGAGSGGTEADASTGEEPDASTGEQPDASVEALEIAGTYSDDFGGSHEITSDSWTQVYESGTSVFNISQVSNKDSYLIAQNDADNEYNPELWSRFDWTERDGSLWYCQTVFDAETEQEALDADPADDSDPANGGCGGFAWTELKPPSGELDIAGDYMDDYDTVHRITDQSWTQVSDFGTSVFEISEFSNDEQYVIAQNAADNDFNAELWSRFDWTEKDGELWFCQVVFDAETEEDALNAKRAVDSDPANGGCGGFAWSKLTRL